MMSLQTSTHSSQMNTVGPAISLRTSFWSLLQKEQRRTSVSPFFFIYAVLAKGYSPFPPADHMIHNTIFLGLGGIHDEVPVRVRGDLVHRLLRVEGQDLVDPVLDPQDLLGLDGDVRGLALGAAPGLVDQDPGVGQGETLAGGPRRQQHRAERSRLPDADRLDVGTHQLHRVIDGHAGGGDAARAWPSMTRC